MSQIVAKQYIIEYICIPRCPQSQPLEWHFQSLMTRLVLFDEYKRESQNSRKVLCTVSFPLTSSILVEHYVQHPMQTVFYPPVTPYASCNLLCARMPIAHDVEALFSRRLCAFFLTALFAHSHHRR